VALLVDPNATAYELLFSFASPEKKDQFLDLVRSNEDRESFMSPQPKRLGMLVHSQRSYPRTSSPMPC
jgi:hypothetical protein